MIVWTTARLAHFDNPLFRCEKLLDYAAAERLRAEKRKVRMAELAPLDAAAHEARRLSQEAYEAAEFAVNDLLHQELEILSDAADIAADTTACLRAKEGLFVLYGGGIDLEGDPELRARDSILRDVMVVGSAHA